MLKTKFSVLMSIYEKDKVEDVELAINSIINQTYKAHQIVVMVDGPISDSMKKLLDHIEFSNKTVEVHYRKRNLGLGLTLNEGLDYCKYEYVARMDADDYSLPNRFEEQISFLENNPDIDVVGSNIYEYDENLKTCIALKKVPEQDEDIKKYMVKRNPFNHMSIIYKKSKVVLSGSYIDCPYFEDYYLWCRMMKKGCKFYNIQKVLMHVRTGSSMIKRRGGKNYNKCILNFQKKIRKLDFISKPQYVRNIIVRTIISLVPNNFRYIFYRKFLRKSV